MSSVSLRRATPDDAAGIAAVRVDGWRSTYRGIMPDAYLDGMKLEDSIAHWSKILAAGSDRICVFVAESEGEIVGFASGMLLSEAKLEMDAELSAIYLKPAFQRSGLGRRMVQEVAKACSSHGAGSLLAWVIAANQAARGFFEGLGAELLIEQDFSWDGLELQEVGYGWRNMRSLLAQGPASLH
jgi:ribosomal protein S18 acetylase RimI-like enzyme